MKTDSLHQFVRKDLGFDIRKSRYFKCDALSKPGLDFFLQVTDGSGPHGMANCRLALFPPSSTHGGYSVEFHADEVGVGVICGVMQGMRDVTPMHMIKTVMAHGRDVEMTRWPLDE